MRRGRKRRVADIVVHCHVIDLAPGDAVAGGPRMGLIVSKAVGNAVVRHAVSRRLRHAWRAADPGLPAQTNVVLRALPGAATASTAELTRQLTRALAALR